MFPLNSGCHYRPNAARGLVHRTSISISKLWQIVFRRRLLVIHAFSTGLSCYTYAHRHREYIGYYYCCYCTTLPQGRVVSRLTGLVMPQRCGSTHQYLAGRIYHLLTHVPRTSDWPRTNLLYLHVHQTCPEPRVTTTPIGDRLTDDSYLNID